MNDAATLHLLHQASLMIASEHSLDRLLQQIVESVRQIVGAKYAALGVANEDGTLDAFIHSGMPSDILQKVPHLPEGHGLLGALISENRTIRIPTIGVDPRSVGFPEHHPPMASFLGVPLIANGRSVGNLYLTEKIGAIEFSAEDERLVEMIAAHAAFAVERAKLWDESQQFNQRLKALNAASIAIGSELNLRTVLKQIIDTARELLNAEYAALGISSADDQLEEFIHSGMPNETALMIGNLPEGHGLLGKIIRDKTPMRIPKIGDDPASVGFPPHHPPMDSFLGVPIIAGQEVLGNLYFTNKIGETEFSVDDQRTVEQFASHAVLAIQKAKLYQKVETVAVTGERNRIGMDLHDGVIQSLYGVGLTLQALESIIEPNEPVNKLITQAMNTLDGAMKEIRTFIMDLRPREFSGNLTKMVEQLTREFQTNVDIPLVLKINIETGKIPVSVTRAVAMTLQEALANIARHAEANQVVVTVEQQDQFLFCTIQDDGKGFDKLSPDHRVGHGLSNMRARMHSADGKFSLSSSLGKGTRIQFSLPILHT